MVECPFLIDGRCTTVQSGLPCILDQQAVIDCLEKYTKQIVASVQQHGTGYPGTTERFFKATTFLDSVKK